MAIAGLSHERHRHRERGAAGIYVCWLALTLSLFITACSTPQQPSSSPTNSRTVSEKTAPAPPKTQRSPALIRLIESAERALSEGECQQAIDIAERGQRIDRYAPELYLILAHGYRCLGQHQQAASFARLGLRYADLGSATHAQLQALLEGVEP